MILYLYILTVIILLAFSFIFSGSETAFFSISNTSRIHLRYENRPIGKWERSTLQSPSKNRATIRQLNILDSLLSNPSILLATILFLNLLVNTTATSIFTLLVITIAKNYDLPSDLLVTIGAIFLTIILVVLCEIAPKLIAIRNPTRFALRTAWLINVFKNFFSFITIPLNKISNWFLVKIYANIHKVPFPSTDDLRTIIKLSEDQGLITQEEENFLFNLVELSSRRVSEIMTPRIKMICLEQKLSITSVLDQINKAALPLYSRIPLYKNTIDNITGVLYLKDLVIKARDRKSLAESVNKIARPAFFIPENKSLSSILEELRKKDSHIAIVIDEYGQTAGLVTLEDVLEALLGEIQDEFDTYEEIPYKFIDTKSYLVSGDIDLKTLDRLFEDFSVNIPKEAGDRLSGFIHHHWGKIPKSGEILTYHNFRIEIKDAKRKRINKVMITKIK